MFCEICVMSEVLVVWKIKKVLFEVSSGVFWGCFEVCWFYIKVGSFGGVW